jgi:hypothetical protein
MQRQRIPSPRNVLPSAEIPQELGAARLPHQGEVIEPQFLEAPPESPTILYFSRDHYGRRRGSDRRQRTINFHRVRSNSNLD